LITLRPCLELLYISGRTICQNKRIKKKKKKSYFFIVQSTAVHCTTVYDVYKIRDTNKE